MTMRRPGKRPPTPEPHSGQERKSPYAIPLSALMAVAYFPATEQTALQAEPSAQHLADGDGGADGD